jgi:hypothetical protein
MVEMTRSVRSGDASDLSMLHALTGIWMVLVALAAFPAAVLAQDEDDQPPRSMHLLTDPENVEAQDAPPAPAKATEKQKKASAAMAAVGGIAILGIGVIAWTMIWARRLRRFARDPGPAQTTLGNDFWFLKPPKSAVSDSEAASSSASPSTEGSE